jgi:hypothetical protein
MSRTFFAFVAFVAFFGIASAVEVTYSGNTPVDFNGTTFGGAADGSPVFFSMTVFTPVVEEPVVEEPVVDNTPEVVPTAPPAVDHIVFDPTAANGHVMYQVYYVDSAVVSYYNMNGQVAVTGQNIPPGVEYYYTEAQYRYHDYIRSYQDSVMLAEHAAFGVQ